MKSALKNLTFNHLSYISIFCLSFLIYIQTLNFQLTYLDDNVWILDYHWYLKDLKNFKFIFTRHDFLSSLFYRPLQNLTFMINACISGDSHVIYRLTNILIHALTSCCVFKLFQKLKYTEKVSLFFALLFVSHPVMTQAVAWIPGRTDSLLGLFGIFTIITYINYIEGKKHWQLGIHLVCLICSLLTKETAVMLPAVCLLFSVFIQNEEKGQNLDIKPVCSWIITVGLWFVLRKLIISDSEQLGLFLLIKSVILNLPALLVYLGKVVMPFNLSVLPILKDSTLLYGAVTVLIIFNLTVMSKSKKTNYFGFGITWFLIFLLPSLVISFLKHEYRLYLPIIGIFIVIAEISGIKTLSEKKKVFWSVLAVLIFACSAATVVYSREYKDRYTYWKNAVKNSPSSPLAHRNLGAMYHLDEQLNLAEIEYKEALRLNPNEQMVHNNLGLIYDRRGKYQLAEQYFLKEIAINPTYDNAHYNLGLHYYRLGKKGRSVRLWKKTIEINPRYLNAYKHLYRHFKSTGDSVQEEYYKNELIKRGVEVN